VIVEAAGTASGAEAKLASLLGVAAKPLVAGGPADTEAAAELAHVGLFAVGDSGEFESEFHLGSLFPRHEGPPVKEANLPKK